MNIVSWLSWDSRLNAWPPGPPPATPFARGRSLPTDRRRSRGRRHRQGRADQRPWGLSGDEMAWLPNLEIVCTGSAGYEAVDLDTAGAEASWSQLPRHERLCVADSAMMLLMPRPALCRPIASCAPADAGAMACRHPDHFRQASGILGLGTIGNRIAQPRRARF